MVSPLGNLNELNPLARRGPGESPAVPGMNVRPPSMSAPGGDPFAQIRRAYDDLLDHVFGGMDDTGRRFESMFELFTRSGDESIGSLANNLESLAGDLLGGLTGRGGPLSGAGSFLDPLKSALDFLSPIGSAVSIGAGLFKGIGSLFGLGGEPRPRTAPLMYGADRRWTPQPSAPPPPSAGTVNVYIDGSRIGSPLEVDRVLGRAGVDRRLREQIREMVRSGSNPARS